MSAGDQLRVICLNLNNYLGKGQMYVERLHNMLLRNLHHPFSFIVYTERHFLGQPFRGEQWWRKLEILRWVHGGWNLYLDLDVVITAPIDKLIHHAKQFPEYLSMRDDFSYSLVFPREDIGPEMHKTLGGKGTCNSSVMIWKDTVKLPCDLELMKEVHGDQNFITNQLYPHSISFLPNDMIQSYKYGLRMRKEPLAPIVVMHGDPKNHQIEEPWVAEHWR